MFLDNYTTSNPPENTDEGDIIVSFAVEHVRHADMSVDHVKWAHPY